MLGRFLWMSLTPFYLKQELQQVLLKEEKCKSLAARGEENHRLNFPTSLVVKLQQAKSTSDFSHCSGRPPGLNLQTCVAQLCCYVFRGFPIADNQLTGGKES